MEKRKLLKLASQIVFFGAVWGITEATIGYLLHFMPPTIAGIIMFPIAVFILVKASKATGSRASLIFVGIVAAGIKAIDFVLPGMMSFKIINPMISIVMESLLVMAVYPLLKKADWKSRLAGSMAASTGWRAGYILYMTGQFLITGFVSNYIASAAAVINFLILNGILSGALVVGVLMAEPKLTLKTVKFRPVYALAAFVFAAGLQLLL